MLTTTSSSRILFVSIAFTLWASCIQQATALPRALNENKGYYHNSGYVSYSSSSSSDSGDNPSSDDALSAPAVALLTLGSLIVVLFCAILGCCFLGDRFRSNKFYKEVAYARTKVLEDAKLASIGKNSQRDQVIIIPFSLGKFSATYLPKHFDKDEVSQNPEYQSTGTMTFHHSVDTSNSTDASDQPSETAASTVPSKVVDSDASVSDKRQEPQQSSPQDNTSSKTVGSDAKETSPVPSTGATAITITGLGKDQDGPFAIRTGKLSLYTGKCYWVEESVGRKSKPTRVLVTGVFSRDEESGLVRFAGQWQSSCGTEGSYARFEVVPNNSKTDLE